MITQSAATVAGIVVGALVFVAFNFAYNLKLPPGKTLFETAEPMVLGLVITLILGAMVGAIAGIIAELTGGSLLFAAVLAGIFAACAAHKLHKSC